MLFALKMGSYFVGPHGELTLLAYYYLPLWQLMQIFAGSAVFCHFGFFVRLCLMQLRVDDAYKCFYSLLLWLYYLILYLFS